MHSSPFSHVKTHKCTLAAGSGFSEDIECAVSRWASRKPCTHFHLQWDESSSGGSGCTPHRAPVCCPLHQVCGSQTLLWCPHLLSLRFQHKHITNSHIPQQTALQVALLSLFIWYNHNMATKRQRDGGHRQQRSLQCYSWDRMRAFGTIGGWEILLTSKRPQ